MQVCLIEKWMNDGAAETYFHCKERYGYGNAVNRNGYTFLIEGNAEKNCIRCLGQEIKIEKTASKIWLFGFSEETSLIADLTLITDGGTLEERFELPFVGGMEQIGWVHDRERILKERKTAFVDAVTSNGKKFCLYASRVDLAKTAIRSLILPDCELMRITSVSAE